MEKAKVNGVELEYHVAGTGDPVLLIGPVLADGFLPLIRERALASRYRLIHYHKRGWVGSTRSEGDVSVEQHASDAAALLDHLGVERAHVMGHSSGAAAAAQLALAQPGRVQSLVLLELSLLSLPEGQAFLSGATPVFEMFRRGEHEAALAAFLSVVSGLDWATCRRLLEQRVPGMIDQSIRDADTFFGVELPALTRWTFGEREARAITAPTLSVLGKETLGLWREVAQFLEQNVPHVTTCRIDGVGHLLHLQRAEPVAAGIADFLARHPIGRRAGRFLAESDSR